MQALAKALFGQSSINGKLPISIPGLYLVGYTRSLPMAWQENKASAAWIQKKGWRMLGSDGIHRPGLSRPGFYFPFVKYICRFLSMASITKQCCHF
jgi:hypothetical protein